jgi:hypothetical protein
MPSQGDFFPDIANCNKAYGPEECILWYRSYRDPERPTAFFYNLYHFHCYPGWTTGGLGGGTMHYNEWHVGEETFDVEESCRDYFFLSRAAAKPNCERVRIWNTNTNQYVRWPMGPWVKYDDRPMGEDSTAHGYVTGLYMEKFFYSGGYHDNFDDLPSGITNVWKVVGVAHPVRYIYFLYPGGLPPFIPVLPGLIGGGGPGPLGGVGGGSVPEDGASAAMVVKLFELLAKKHRRKRTL